MPSEISEIEIFKVKNKYNGSSFVTKPITFADIRKFQSSISLVLNNIFTCYNIYTSTRKRFFSFQNHKSSSMKILFHLLFKSCMFLNNYLPPFIGIKTQFICRK